MKTCDECIMKNTGGCPKGCVYKDCEILEIGRIGEPMNTNLRMLKDLDAEQLYDKMVWLFQDYGRRFADSRAAIIEWLNSEVKA